LRRVSLAAVAVVTVGCLGGCATHAAHSTWPLPGGDLAGTRVHDPIVVPWSSGQDIAPPLLRNTVAAALGAEAYS